MKRIRTIILLATLSVISALNANAQTGGPDAGGLWCYVDVDLKHDVREDGWAYYEITTPIPNGDNLNLTPSREIFCSGPGRPVLIERDGNMCLKLYLKEIEMNLLDEEFGTMYVDVDTDTLVTVLGWWARPVDVPKYYTIQLNVKNTDW